MLLSDFLPRRCHSHRKPGILKLSTSPEVSPTEMPPGPSSRAVLLGLPPGSWKPLSRLLCSDMHSWVLKATFLQAPCLWPGAGSQKQSSQASPGLGTVFWEALLGSPLGGMPELASPLGFLPLAGMNLVTGWGAREEEWGGLTSREGYGDPLNPPGSPWASGLPLALGTRATSSPGLSWPK